MARLAVTPEAAEAMSNSHYMGLFKNELGQGGHKPTATYAMLPATVEADRAFSDNPANRKQVVQPRAQSAIDTPYKSADLYSGARVRVRVRVRLCVCALLWGYGSWHVRVRGNMAAGMQQAVARTQAQQAHTG
jgi:hypothetical protein